jgi:hypothetical protein
MNNDNIKGIHAYVYNSRRHPVGVLAAQPSEADPQRVIIGWSKCNASAGDRFNKQLGVKIAYERSAQSSYADIPESMNEEYDLFLTRAQRYFQNKKVIG